MDEDEFQEVENHLQPETRARPAREGFPWGGVLLLIWAVALIVFSVQNAEHTTVEFLAWEWDMPVALLVMITALATLVLTGVGSAVYRRTRRKRAEAKRSPESGG
jgi:uncharacterized integral membrane protein